MSAAESARDARGTSTAARPLVLQAPAVGVCVRGMRLAEGVGALLTLHAAACCRVAAAAATVLVVVVDASRAMVVLCALQGEESRTQQQISTVVPAGDAGSLRKLARLRDHRCLKPLSLITNGLDACCSARTAGHTHLDVCLMCSRSEAAWLGHRRG